MKKTASNRPPAHLYDLNDSVNTCFLCENPLYSPYIAVTQYGFEFEFRRCQCGMIKQTPMPNEQFFEWFFNSDHFFTSEKTKDNKIWGYQDYFRDESNRLMTSKWRYRRLKKYFPDDKVLHIMKIGPSTGTFLHVANQHGHEAIGCDVSSRFRNFAQKTYGVKVDVGRFEKKGYDDGQFDRLMLFSVIENVPNLGEFMKEIRRTVKVGGYFIFNYVDMKRNIIAALQKSKYSLFRPPICYIMDRTVVPRFLDKYGFRQVDELADLRIMNVEKILTLFGWTWLWRLARAISLHRIPIPVYAYPSKIVVAERIT